MNSKFKLSSIDFITNIYLYRLHVEYVPYNFYRHVMPKDFLVLDNEIELILRFTFKELCILKFILTFENIASFFAMVRSKLFSLKIWI